jgi:hypothetical protein
MAKIESYSLAPSPISGSDKLIGTDTQDNNATKNFTVSELQLFIFENASFLPTYLNNNDALLNGLVAGNIYQTPTGELRIVY